MCIFLICFTAYVSYYFYSVQDQVADKSSSTKENPLISRDSVKSTMRVVIEKPTVEDENIVNKISENIIGTEIGKPGKEPETNELKFFYEVFLFDMEIGSGASFEQYFRWSENTEVRGIVQKLEELELEKLADTTKKAIAIAFPDGIPYDDKKYHELTYWTEKQEGRLSKLYQEVAHYHGVVTIRLANYARDKELIKMERFSEQF